MEVGSRVGAVTEAPVSRFLSCESAVVHTTAVVAPSPSAVSGSTDHGFTRGLWHQTSRGTQHGLWWQDRPRTLPWLSPAAQDADTMPKTHTLTPPEMWLRQSK